MNTNLKGNNNNNLLFWSPEQMETITGIQLFKYRIYFPARNKKWKQIWLNARKSFLLMSAHYHEDKQ